MGTVGVFLQALALAQQVVVFALGTALGGHLQTVRDDALIVAELEGRLALLTSLRAIVGAADDLALSVDSKLEVRLALLAQSFGRVLLAPNYNFEAFPRDEDKSGRAELALERSFRLAALLSQSVASLAL